MIRKELKKAATAVMVALTLPFWVLAQQLESDNDTPGPDLSDDNDRITDFEATTENRTGDQRTQSEPDDSMSTDTLDTDDTEQVYRNELFGRTITADRQYTGRGFDTLAVHVEDDEQDGTVELTLDELAALSRGVGNCPRRPPRRDLSSTIEGHYEIIDHGDCLTVDVPHARFRISRSVAEMARPWVVTEHDEGHSWKVTDGPTRNAALVNLLERLGLVWNADD